MSQTPKLVFYGCPFEPTGYGKAARAYVHAFHRAGIALSVVNLAKRIFVRDHVIESLLQKPLADALSLCHADPSLMVAQNLPFPRTIAMTTWEGDRIPERWIKVLNNVMEVWVPCRHNENVFASSVRRTVFRLPHPIPLSVADTGTDEVSDRDINGRLGLGKDTFVFYSVFSWQDRKCPLAIIESFLKAFDTPQNVALVIKTGFELADRTKSLSAVNDLMRRAARSGNGTQPRVEIVEEFWPETAMRALARRGDCYVSLHRGEGWCYPLFEAALLGTPVIATDYSGPCDYLQPEFHNLVRHKLVPARQQFSSYNSFQNVLWAEPDTDHAASLMRHVYQNSDLAREKAESGAQLLKRAYSLEAIGEIARNRLDALEEILNSAHGDDNEPASGSTNIQRTSSICLSC